MEENKYYTPEIEEFYIGFEYEIWGWNGKDWTWKKEVFDIFTFDSMPDTPDGGEKPFKYFIGNINELRVKYINKENIESLGWVLTYSYLDNKYFDTFRFSYTQKCTGELKEMDYVMGYTLYKEDHTFKSYANINIKMCYDKYITTFSGKIKNISELKKLLTQLGI